jgi:hypothetical protein
VSAIMMCKAEWLVYARSDRGCSAERLSTHLPASSPYMAIAKTTPWGSSRAYSPLRQPSKRSKYGLYQALERHAESPFPYSSSGAPRARQPAQLSATPAGKLNIMEHVQHPIGVDLFGGSLVEEIAEWAVRAADGEYDGQVELDDAVQELLELPQEVYEDELKLAKDVLLSEGRLDALQELASSAMRISEYTFIEHGTENGSVDSVSDCTVIGFGMSLKDSSRSQSVVFTEESLESITRALKVHQNVHQEARVVLLPRPLGIFGMFELEPWSVSMLGELLREWVMHNPAGHPAAEEAEEMLKAAGMDKGVDRGLNASITVRPVLIVGMLVMRPSTREPNPGQVDSDVAKHEEGQFPYLSYKAAHEAMTAEVAEIRMLLSSALERGAKRVTVRGVKMKTQSAKRRELIVTAQLLETEKMYPQFTARHLSDSVPMKCFHDVMAAAIGSGQTHAGPDFAPHVICLPGPIWAAADAALCSYRNVVFATELALICLKCGGESHAHATCSVKLDVDKRAFFVSIYLHGRPVADLRWPVLPNEHPQVTASILNEALGELHILEHDCNVAHGSASVH